MLINFNHLKTFYNALVHKMNSSRGNWEQNDPTADDYIKNRTHYSEGIKDVTVLEYIVDTDTGSASPMDSAGPEIYHIFFDATDLQSFVVGQQYSVKWNNASYTCVAKMAKDLPALGDVELTEGYEGSGEPFLIVLNPKENFGIIMTTQAGKYPITVTTRQEVVHKLDKKFIDLPDNLVTDDALAEVAKSGSYYDLMDTPTIYTDVVRYNNTQSLTTTQKSTVRNNIGAGTSNFSGSYNDLSNKPTVYTDVVRYADQSLTLDQQAQARYNINVAAIDEVYEISEYNFVLNWDGNIDGITDIIGIPIGDFYKISDKIIPYKNILSVFGTEKLFSSDRWHTTSFEEYYLGVGCYVAGFTYGVADTFTTCAVVVTEVGECSCLINNRTYTFTAPSTGIYLFGRTDLSRYASELNILYKDRGGLLLCGADGRDNVIAISPNGALSTTNSDGNVVVMATINEIPNSYTKEESDARYLIQSDAVQIIWKSATDVTDYVTPHGQRNVFYKITDEVFDISDLDGAYFIVDMGDGRTDKVDLNNVKEIQGGCSQGNAFCSIYDTVVNLGIASDGEPDTFPSTGTYLGMSRPYDVQIVIPKRIKKIDDKYLPNNLVTTSELSTAINNALGVIENGTY